MRCRGVERTAAQCFSIQISIAIRRENRRIFLKKMGVARVSKSISALKQSAGQARVEAFVAHVLPVMLSHGRPAAAGRELANLQKTAKSISVISEAESPNHGVAALSSTPLDVTLTSAAPTPPLASQWRRRDLAVSRNIRRYAERYRRHRRAIALGERHRQSGRSRHS